MERPTWAPQGIDLSVPSVSRMYDYYLGGSHNFEVDRVTARKALEAFPGLPKIMQANRAFMRRAVRYAVNRGITQFLDIGSGIPTFGNVHELAIGANPAARVLYVDNDPVAVAHSRAVLRDVPGAGSVAGDFHEPEAILGSPEAKELLDLTQPVVLMLVALLHFVPDDQEVRQRLATLRDALAPGSLLVLSHASVQHGPVTVEQGERLIDVYQAVGTELVMRQETQVAGFFDGFELVDPGLVPIGHWRPEDSAEDEDPLAFSGIAGVGRKA
ncbi:SAM-dependent methyltransferase [Streptomyces sp. DSM 44915]|uniref:SAM-dependent methyltransferase n=1 Tax=Streptomyces chisholmiae TaxID=3075540 RepID=A0ABU2JVX8_9ACTN|nr:SAM-dependent methyltransferase [Streptomyces sp. DSM 44915]MDT0268388.1 SAM-dependent methyltransferase [Streptomyces sp. DSM 44915]